MQKVLIASNDLTVKESIKEFLGEKYPTLEVYDVLDDPKLYYHLTCVEETLVLIDKFFLGFKLEEQILCLKLANKKLRIVFMEKGNCSTYFGLRTYLYGADGFISNVEDKELMGQQLKIVLSGEKYFPEVLQTDIDNGVHLSQKRSCNAITPDELDVAIYFSVGFSIKGIASELHITENCVRSHMTYVKRKSGITKDSDFGELYKQTCLVNIGGWRCL